MFLQLSFVFYDSMIPCYLLSHWSVPAKVPSESYEEDVGDVPFSVRENITPETPDAV
jgi:hypothetical protein